jgi:hypothetical protein
MGLRQKFQCVAGNRKRLRAWGKILGIFFILFILAGIGVSIYLSRLVNRRLSAIVTAASDGLYKLKYSGVRINALTSRLTIYNAELMPDTAIYAQAKQ